MLLFAGLALVTIGIGAAAAQTADGDGEADVEPAALAIEVTDVVPDLVVWVDAPGLSAEARSATLDEVVRAIDGRAGVTWVALDATAAPGPNVLVGLDDEREGVGLTAVRQELDRLGTESDQPGAAGLTVGGRVVVDEELRSRIVRALVAVILFGAIAVGGLVGWLGGIRHGLLTGVTVAAAAGLAGGAGPSAAVFDGSIVTTAVPTVLVALLVASFLALRLVLWFARPEGEDPAEQIRSSLWSMALEVALLLASLVVAAVLVGLLDPGRSMAVGVLVGALTAVLVTGAVMAPGLAALDGAGHPVRFDPADGEGAGVDGVGVDDARRTVREVLGSRPNGRDLPVAVLLAGGFVLGFLALVALTSTTVPRLVDEGDVAAATATAEHLRTGGGDPTMAVVAAFPAGTDQQLKGAWLQRVSQLDAVGRVDTAVSRHVGGAEVALEGSPLGPLSTLLDGNEAPTHAVVVPVVSGRSGAALGLVDAIRATDGPVGTDLSGVPVTARSAAERDRSVVWITVAVLTVVAAAVVYGLTGDGVVAGVAGGLRLLDALAVIGLHHLVVGAVDGSALLLTVFLVSIGLGAYEVGTLRRLMAPVGSDDDHERVTAALDHEGWAAAVALVTVAVAVLGFIGAGFGTLARDGVVLALVLFVEVIVGLWLLRPAVLAARAVSSAAARPVRAALQTVVRGAEESDEQRHWAGVVDALLAAEFRLQLDPAGADLDEVFIPGSPAQRVARDHHSSLAEAGLRVTGRPPLLRSVRLAAGASRPALAVTVDYPVRRLIDGDDRVVGVRKPERRTSLLWLRQTGPGLHRIADQVELGVEPLVAAQPATPPVADPTLRLSVDHGAG